MRAVEYSDLKPRMTPCKSNTSPMKEGSGDNELEIALHDLSIIEPPKLEDAGLEDCALPPHSIMEAFSRAAAASKSRSIDDDDEEGEEEESTTNNGGGNLTAVKDGDDTVVTVGGDDQGGEKPYHDGEGDDDKDPRTPNLGLNTVTGAKQGQLD